MDQTSYKALPGWILVVSGIIALLEIAVSFSPWFSPESVADRIDLNAKGVNYLMQTWAVRQFALGVIFAFAVYKRSAAMLIPAFVFFLVIMAGDVIIGLIQNNNPLIITAVIMCLLSIVMLYTISRKK